MSDSVMSVRPRPGAGRWLLLLVASLLLLDCAWLVTRKVTHFGVIVPALIGLVMLLLAVFGPRWQGWLRQRRWRVLAWRAVLAGFVLWLLSLLVFFAVMQGLRPGSGDEVEPKAIVVLGSSTPNAQASPTLAERLKLAHSLALRHPQAVVVVSGGTDFKQTVPEARVMADYLGGLGLDTRRIALEDQSTSTYENLLFSARLLLGQGIGRDAPMLLVTSDFHTARAGWIARKAGWTAVRTAGAMTPLYMRYNAWTREYFAVLSGWLLGEY
jgi:uncharacterized SAM-binding protein YcdF (DUF218 family)